MQGFLLFLNFQFRFLILTSFLSCDSNGGDDGGAMQLISGRDFALTINSSWYTSKQHFYRLKSLQTAIQIGWVDANIFKVVTIAKNLRAKFYMGKDKNEYFMNASQKDKGYCC